MSVIEFSDAVHPSGTYPGKRAADIAFVAMLSPLLLIPVGVLALAIRMDGHNPFYSQIRVGRNGRHFRIWKLRSMVPNADARLAELLETDEEARREWDTFQKLTRDPRVTPLGRLLRKFSLDELPQFWNVLLGDMSIVGPRPILPEQEALYPSRAYFHMRPGITGPWQVSRRNAVSFASRAQYDGEYLHRQSPAFDLTLVLRTIGVLVRPNGK